MRVLFLIIASIALLACSHDAQYYSEHPQLTKKALLDCQNHAPKATLNCQQLEKIASKINDLAMQLQMDPQDFGRHILSMQTIIANERAAMLLDPKETKLQALIEKNTHELAEHLAIVKWLESPTS